MHEGCKGEFDAKEANQELLLACAVGKKINEDGMSTKTMSKTTETEAPKKKPLISKEWLIDQKSLIALIFWLLSFKPELLPSTTSWTFCAKTSVNAIIAVGMTLVIFNRGNRLSAGSCTGTCGAFAASMIGMEIPVMIAVPTALVAGAALGATAVWLSPRVRFKPSSQRL